MKRESILEEHARLTVEREAARMKRRATAMGEPQFYCEVKLGGKGGHVPILMRERPLAPIPPGSYACFPVDRRLGVRPVELPLDLAKRLEPHLLALIFENGNGPKAEDVLAFTEALKKAAP